MTDDGRQRLSTRRKVDLDNIIADYRQGMPTPDICIKYDITKVHLSGLLLNHGTGHMQHGSSQACRMMRLGIANAQQRADQESIFFDPEFMREMVRDVALCDNDKIVAAAPEKREAPPTVMPKRLVVPDCILEGYRLHTSTSRVHFFQMDGASLCGITRTTKHRKATVDDESIEHHNCCRTCVLEMRRRKLRGESIGFISTTTPRKVPVAKDWALRMED